MLVEVYIKPSCSLCEEALDLLHDEGIVTVTHNIFTQHEWFELYRYDVPVVTFDGVPRLKLRFTAQDLQQVLQQY